MRIKTNSLEPGAPKDTEGSTLFEIWQAFATPEETAEIRRCYAQGIGWGEMKKRLFDHLDAHLAAPRAEYERLMADPAHVERVLLDGAARAREVAAPLLARVRDAVGIRRLAGQARSR